jgi:hypothetical protein
MNPDLEVFLQAWTGGADVPEADRERLLRRLESDAAFRAECAAEIRLLGMLRAVQSPSPRWLDINDALGLSAPASSPAAADDLSVAVLDRLRGESAAAGRSRGLVRRPLTAAAVGIVVGMLCTSAVLGFATRPAGRSTTLVREGFEEGPAPAVTGVPAEPGRWSGDYSEVVGGQQGVTPAKGASMLRFLRSDHDGSTGPRPRRGGDVMRVVDVGRLSHSIDRGAVMVTLSAVFDAAAFPADERYDGLVTIYALDDDIELANATEDVVQQEALAFSSGDVRFLDRDPATWQPATTRLLLPPATRLVLVKVTVRRMPVGKAGLDSLPEKVSFAGHFVDDVQASLVIDDTAASRQRRSSP